MTSSRKILLHTCCGPCSTHCINVLRADNFEPALFFSNSNIAPVKEYKKRLESAAAYAQANDVVFIEDAYDNNAWLETIRGLEDEPEGGLRCSKCFFFNIRRTAQFALSNGFEHITSSLTISPHKRSSYVFEAGDAAVKAALDEIGRTPGLVFEHYDFKKKNGFHESLKLASKFELYRQSYCGCLFSRRDN
jgi:predicted adenine nucleotide alpha hydrolase (AANH) superfamily ATPase